MFRYVLIFLVLFLTACNTTSNPAGSTWAVADFENYDKNYSDFDTSSITIGMSKGAVIAIFGDKFNAVGASQEGETIAYDKWRSVTGPDYVEKTLNFTFNNDALVSWEIQDVSKTKLVR